MTSFSLLSATNHINAQSIDWVNPSELKWRVSNTAVIDTHNGRPYALLRWPLSFSPAPATPDPITKLLSHAAVALPHASLPGNWHGLDSHCSVAASLFLRDPLAQNSSPAWSVVHQHHQNGFFFLCGYREKAIL